MSDIAGSLVPLSKQQAMLMVESAYLLMELGKLDQARETALGCALLMPKSEVPQLALGSVEFGAQKYDKALQAYRAAQRLAPKAALPRAHCGEALQAMGKFTEAMKELVAATEAEPGSGGAAFAIALMIIIANKEYDANKLEASLKTLSTVVKIDPDNALGQAHYGKVLVLLEKHEEGAAALNRAAALDTDGDGGRIAAFFLEAIKVASKKK